MNKKVILAIADGIRDRPCEVLNNMILFGYDIEDYPGRGPIEASGRGIELELGDVAFRSNFATVNERLNVIDRRASRIREKTNILADAINGIEMDGVKVLFKEATEHRAVNIKAADLMGHDNKPKEKVKAVELFDKFIGHLLEYDLKDVIIAVAADHSTPCEREEHSGDPVPILINGPGVRRDRIDKFNEIDCSHGGLGRIKGYEFVNTLFDYLELTKKQGN